MFEYIKLEYILILFENIKTLMYRNKGLAHDSEYKIVLVFVRKYFVLTRIFNMTCSTMAGADLFGMFQ